MGYVDQPGDTAPPGKLLNARPIEPLGDLERGGQRPGVRERTDRAGEPWGRLGEGPITLITSIPKPARVTGYRLGAGKATHQAWESRESGDLSGNLFIVRGKDAPRPSMSRHASIGRTAAPAPTFEDGLLRDLTALVWTGDRTLFGGVNENPSTGDRDAIVFRSSYVAGVAANNGFGSPAWTEYTNFDDPATWSATGGPWPIESAAVFYEDASSSGGVVLGNIAFAAMSVIQGGSEPQGKGIIVPYFLDSSSPTGGAVRPWGRTYNGAVQGSVSPNPGAIEVTALRAMIVGGMKRLYFAYNANPNSESMVGCFNCNNFGTTGLQLNIPGSGAFQTNGNTFEIGAASPNFTAVPTDPLSPHRLSVNYPRGARPMDVALDPQGYVYVVQTSAGWGPQWNGGANPSHHPDFPGHKPINVFKVDPAGSRFEWESHTHVVSTESGATRIANPELLWVEADELGCYAGGREVLGANVFALNSADGGIRWKWRSCATGQGSSVFAAAVDPGDGHLWVAGDRRNDWQGVTASRYANLWKLDRESGAVLADFDVGASVSVLSLDINPETGLMALGTNHPD